MSEALRDQGDPLARIAEALERLAFNRLVSMASLQFEFFTSQPPSLDDFESPARA